MPSGCDVASSSCGLCASFVICHWCFVISALLSMVSCICDIRIIFGELIAERVFPKWQASAIEHKIFLETIRHVGLPLHGGYDCSLLGHGESFREPAALRVSSCQRPEKPWFSTT
jgi:hypothetical protein